ELTFYVLISYYWGGLRSKVKYKKQRPGLQIKRHKIMNQYSL
ncbi:hypothetical protein JL09_g6212, partial [Pichia kudriavzevii]